MTRRTKPSLFRRLTSFIGGLVSSVFRFIGKVLKLGLYFTLACGIVYGLALIPLQPPNYIDKPDPHVDRLNRAIAEFEETFGIPVTLDIEIGRIARAGVLGYCMLPGKKSSHYIKFNKTSLSHLSDLQLKALVWHELGHCVLFKDHGDPLQYPIIPYSSGFCPSSLMTPTIQTEACLERFQDFYFSRNGMEVKKSSHKHNKKRMTPRRRGGTTFVCKDGTIHVQ